MFNVFFFLRYKKTFEITMDEEGQDSGGKGDYH